MNTVDRIKSDQMLETPEYSEMPKCEKSTLAVNQQGRSLAYIIGVYFGDGYTASSYWKGQPIHSKMFRLCVIDKDFRDYCAECCKDAFVARKTTLFETIKNGKMFYGLQVAGYGNYIELVTGKRTLTPNFIYTNNDTKKAFVEGLLDSEGWVQMQIGKKGTSVNTHIGFAITSEIVHELKNILESIGVKTGKVSTYTKDRKKALKQLNINVKSFIDSGLVFHCKRKQARIDAFKMILKVAEIANKISRNIINGSLRDLTSDSMMEMIKSELHSDMKSVAEMTTPASLVQ